MVESFSLWIIDGIEIRSTGYRYQLSCIIRAAQFFIFIFYFYLFIFFLLLFVAHERYRTLFMRLHTFFFVNFSYALRKQLQNTYSFMHYLMPILRILPGCGVNEWAKKKSGQYYQHHQHRNSACPVRAGERDGMNYTYIEDQEFLMKIYWIFCHGLDSW